MWVSLETWMKLSPEGPRHAVVDLGDDDPRRLGGGLGHADLDAEAAEAVRVGRAEVDQGHVERQDAAAEEVRDFRQETGREIRAPLVDGPAHVAADEQGVDADMPLHAGRDVIGVAEGEQVDELDGRGEARARRSPGPP